MDEDGFLQVFGRTIGDYFEQYGSPLIEAYFGFEPDPDALLREPIDPQRFQEALAEASELPSAVINEIVRILLSAHQDLLEEGHSEEDINEFERRVISRLGNPPPPLPRVPLAIANVPNGWTCPICHDLAGDVIVKGQNCDHLFHRSCLVRWIHEGHPTCPLCRRPVNEFGQRRRKSRRRRKSHRRRKSRKRKSRKRRKN
jgi:hypothetical protein